MLTAAAPHAAAISVHTPGGALLAVTELRSDTGPAGSSMPPLNEPAAVVVFDIAQGSATVLDQRAPRVSLPQSLHYLWFHVSADALAEFGLPPSSALKCAHAGADPWLESLARSLLPVLHNPRNANRLFVARVLCALTAHIAHRYGGAQTSTVHPRVRLAPWQERRAKELMVARLTGVSVAELAAQCRLSPSHFARAFRNCTGLSPHRWLLACRIQRAKELILKSQSSLLEIALSCGFLDQSHLSRAFVKLTGTTPAAWRRGRRIRVSTKG